MSAGGERWERNCFTGDVLERARPGEHDAERVRARLAEPGTRVIVMRDLTFLAETGRRARPVFFEPARIRPVLDAAESPLLLGDHDGRAVFAVSVPDGEAARFALDATDAPAGHGYAELRAIAPLLPAPEAAMLARARALVHWHHVHRFCATCGAPSRPTAIGHLRVCSDAACGRQHFPRTDPAIIVLVTRETGEGPCCLLGRQARWPQGMYSALAGFVEPGEALEEAVRREVYEEAGVRLDAVCYHSSQPWPFPASLMVGFFATTRQQAIVRHDEELEDARWFSRTELVEELAAGRLRLPTPVSIARRLLEDWYDPDGGDALAGW